MCDGTYWNPCDCETETVGLLLLTVIDHQRIQDQECQEGKNRVQRSGWVYQFSVVALRNCHKLGAQIHRTFFFPCRRSQRHPLQYSCLENPMDGGAWWASVHGVTKSRTQRLHFHFSPSCTGEGNGNPLQCSCLENPREGGAWWAAVYGVAQSQTRLKRLSSSSSSSWSQSLKSVVTGLHSLWAI